MEKILILGINGFSGHHFRNYIKNNDLSSKFNIIGGDLKNSEHLIPFKLIQADLTKYQELKYILISEKPDYIINLAGILKSDNLDILIKINAEISRNIFECVVENNLQIKKILLIGSAAEYGDPKTLPVNEEHPLLPINYYGLSKTIQTKYMQYYSVKEKLNINIARTFNVIGRHISPSLSIGAFIKRIKESKDGDEILVGNISTKRDFLAIDDVIDAYWKILLNGKSGEIYNVCANKSYSIKKILYKLIENSKKSLKVVINQDWISNNDIFNIYGDNTKLKCLNWFPRKNIFDLLATLLN